MNAKRNSPAGSTLDKDNVSPTKSRMNSWKDVQSTKHHGIQPGFRKCPILRHFSVNAFLVGNQAHGGQDSQLKESLQRYEPTGMQVEATHHDADEGDTSDAHVVSSDLVESDREGEEHEILIRDASDNVKKMRLLEWLTEQAVNERQVWRRQKMSVEI